jgi:hypothetical protein
MTIQVNRHDNIVAAHFFILILTHKFITRLQDIETKSLIITMNGLVNGIFSSKN